jgi:pimeloyl-ACP methyl ester carboxylesterase
MSAMAWCCVTLMLAGNVGYSNDDRSASDTFLDTELGKIWYDVQGSGPSLVLLHDGLIPAPTWDRQMPAFAAHFHTVRYDRRSHGRSEAPKGSHSDIDDLLALFDALKIETATVLGCSSGGELAVDFSLAHPKRVAKLVLEGPIVSGLGFTDHFRMRGLRNSRPMFEAGDVAQTIENWTNDPYLIDQRNTDARATLHTLLTRWPESATWRTASSRPAAKPALSQLGQIRIPTLIVVGDHDIPDVHAHCGALEAGIAQAQRRVIAGAGHLAHIEQPDFFNRLVIDFLLPQEVARRAFERIHRDDVFDKTKELLRYDRAAPIDVVEVGKKQEGDVTVLDITYASPGGRVPAFVVQPPGSGPFAGVLWLHHGQGNRSTYLGEAIELASSGVLSILIDSPENRPENKNRQQKPFDPTAYRAEKTQTLVDLMRAIDLLCQRSDIDKSRVAYVGHSLGSTLGGVLVGIDSRIRASVLMAGFAAESEVARYGQTRYGTAFRTLVPEDKQPEFLDAIAPFDGVQTLSHAAGPILFQFAERDEFIERWDAELGQLSAGPAKTVQWFDTNHWMNEAAREARDKWLLERLRP